MSKSAAKQPLPDMVAKRQNAVAALFSAGKNPSEIVRELDTANIVNPKTRQPYSRTTVLNDLKTANLKKSPLAETIGTQTWAKPLWKSRTLLSIDTLYKDYIFFDNLRRGYAPGYEIGGLFVTPVAQTIASYALSGGITATLMESALSTKMMDTAKIAIHENGKPTQNLKNAQQTGSSPRRAGTGKPNSAAPTNGKAPGKFPPAGNMQPILPPPPPPEPPADDPVAYTNAQLRRMMERYQGFFQTVLVDSYCLGNAYIVVNPDCTFAQISPETVTVEYSAADYRRPLRYIISTRMQKARVEDIYTAEKRTVRIHYYDERGMVESEYENLIGRIPIVHIANDRSANEIYGRPIIEPCLPLMRKYDDLIYKTVEGVELLSNPIPAFTGLDNPGETRDLNSDAELYTDENGVQQTRYTTRFDRNAGLYIGKGGDAKMLASPVGFTKDSLDTLRQLFLLLLSNQRIPEVLWGGAIQSSKASADVQMPPFIQYVKFRRLQLEGEGADPALGIDARGGLLELVDIFLRTYKLLNPAIVVGPARIDWPEIDLKNDLLRYQWGTYLSGVGKLSDVDTIKLAGYWEDPEGVVARANGHDRRPPKFDKYDAKLKQAALDAARASQIPQDGDEPPFWSTDYVTPEDDGNDDYFTVAGPLYWPGIGGGRY